MNVDFYNSVDHARQYLDGCIVCHRGETRFISTVRRSGRSYILNLRPVSAYYEEYRGEGDDVGYTDPDLILLPKQMGFFPMPREWNTEEVDAVVRIDRRPSRQWKVGITGDNTQCMGAGRYLGWSLNSGVAMRIDSLSAVFTGQYPTVPEALRLLEDPGVTQVAISPLYLVEEDGLVFHASLSSSVGTIQDGRIILNENRSFLHESLVQGGFPC